MRVVLLHSPLVGPSTWTAVARLLRRSFDQVVVPDLRAAVTGEPPYQPAITRVVTDTVGREPNGGPLVIVGHSGAGPLLPGIAHSCRAAVDGLVYVDAGLPRPGTSWIERAPTDLADEVRQLETGGLLPPWDEWFDSGAVEALLPDPTVLEQFRRELPRVPIGFLAEATPAMTWGGPSGYLLLSEGYLADLAEARGDGWPVREHFSHHLAMLTEPGEIADALTALCRSLIPDSTRS